MAESPTLPARSARPGASVAEQTRAVLAQIDRLLAEAGSDKSRILTATIWLADIGDFRRDEFGVGHLGRSGQPARARDRREQARGARIQSGDHRGRGLRLKPASWMPLVTPTGIEPVFQP